MVENCRGMGPREEKRRKKTEEMPGGERWPERQGWARRMERGGGLGGGVGGSERPLHVGVRSLRENKEGRGGLTDRERQTQTGNGKEAEKGQMEIGLPDLANKNTVCTARFEFQI